MDLIGAVTVATAVCVATLVVANFANMTPSRARRMALRSSALNVAAGSTRVDGLGSGRFIDKIKESGSKFMTRDGERAQANKRRPSQRQLSVNRDFSLIRTMNLNYTNLHSVREKSALASFLSCELCWACAVRRAHTPRTCCLAVANLAVAIELFAATQSSRANVWRRAHFMRSSTYDEFDCSYTIPKLVNCR